MRFITFMIVSVVFTKPHLTNLTQNDIGNFEMMMFIAGALGFFWVTGIIQSFLPLYDNNQIFRKKTTYREKSPEIFNTFLLLCLFSATFGLLIFLLRNTPYLRYMPHLVPLIIYFVLSNVTSLVEYIYYVRNRPYLIVIYVISTSISLLILVCGPALLGWGIKMAIWGLITITAIKFVWLIVLLQRHAEFKFSFAYMRVHLKLGSPLIASTLLSGSSQYIDGFLASWVSTPKDFAIFRFGAKELPFSSSLSNGLSHGVLTEFSSPENVRRTLYKLKNKSLKMMHYLFPISIVVMLFSDWIFGHLFNHDFLRSSDIFMVYLLMVISRMLFPHTILIGLKKTRVVFWASLLEIILNILVSLLFIPHYGVVGIALGTALVHALEKLFLIAYNYYQLRIAPRAYIPIGWFMFYTSIISLVFILIDRRIIIIR